MRNCSNCYFVTCPKVGRAGAPCEYHCDGTVIDWYDDDLIDDNFDDGEYERKQQRQEQRQLDAMD